MAKKKTIKGGKARTRREAVGRKIRTLLPQSVQSHLKASIRGYMPHRCLVHIAYRDQLKRIELLAVLNKTMQMPQPHAATPHKRNIQCQIRISLYQSYCGHPCPQRLLT